MNDQLNTLLNSLFLLGKEKFIANKEIDNVFVLDTNDEDNQKNILFNKYFTYLLNESYLNEKDIDLIDIHFSYIIRNEKDLYVEASFTSPEPKTFKSLTINGTFEQIAPKIEEFIKSCYDMYPEVVKLYTIKSIWEEKG